MTVFGQNECGRVVAVVDDVDDEDVNGDNVVVVGIVVKREHVAKGERKRGLHELFCTYSSPAADVRSPHAQHFNKNPPRTVELNSPP